MKDPPLSGTHFWVKISKISQKFSVKVGGGEKWGEGR